MIVFGNIFNPWMFWGHGSGRDLKVHRAQPPAMSFDNLEPLESGVVGMKRLIKTKTSN